MVTQKPMTTALPATALPGAIPTLNGRGFMLEALDEYAEAFARTAAAAGDGESLDIGCAYGVATLAALERGARICACDMEPRHLSVLEGQVPVAQRSRLRTVVGVLPGVAFPAASFDAILASRVVHFLTGDDIRLALAAMGEWLKPGGRLYLVADTPYMPSWNSIVPAYEAARLAGDPWPGFIADFENVVSRHPGAMPGPRFLNTLDPDILARECRRAGLQVERTSFFGMQRLGASSSGREHAGCVALKRD
jgi:SAM-dependent methyltransferase